MRNNHQSDLVMNQMRTVALSAQVGRLAVEPSRMDRERRHHVHLRSRDRTPERFFSVSKWLDGLKDG